MDKPQDYSKLIISVFIAILFLNIGIIYWLIIGVKTKVAKADPTSISGQNVKTKLEQVVLKKDKEDADICPRECDVQINNLKKTIAKITPQTVQEEKKSGEQAVRAKEAAVKEYSISLGSGKITSTDWEDVPGVNAYIDTSNYSNIEKVIFEVSLRIPTANDTIYARLYNKTDSKAIVKSEVSSFSKDADLKQASNISLSAGNKLYQLQMKSQFGRESFADSARIKVFVK